ncbi:MAG: hypothetical protein D6761_09640 [Candidatus Dadabacteria bacterium]|nr:MAG: hypothetical protein D6761_09640 [Candidatus Dadabacteria bacterium]
MVPGFNHNVMHRGQMFHIQTEDRGLKRPEIITHLFIGGNIIDSRRTSYADIVMAENLDEIVREMMEEQHKNMLRDLKNGRYDDKIARFGGAPAKDATEPAAQAPADEQTGSLDEIILNYLASND